MLRLPEVERAVAASRTTVRLDPDPYFRIRTTGRVHSVREVRDVARDGEAWVSVWYWCNNLGLGSAGDFLMRPSRSALVCQRCAESSQATGRGRRS